MNDADAKPDADGDGEADADTENYQRIIRELLEQSQKSHVGEFGRPLDGHYIYGLDSGKRRKMAISQDNPYRALEKESDDLHGQV